MLIRFLEQPVPLWSFLLSYMVLMPLLRFAWSVLWRGVIREWLMWKGLWEDAS